MEAPPFSFVVLPAKPPFFSRNQQEEDLRENHPFFDKPLFAVGRESRFRDLCKFLVEARYVIGEREPGASALPDDKSNYKTFQ